MNKTVDHNGGVRDGGGFPFKHLLYVLVLGSLGG
jgi:hypothetical protein